ncbi:hypothetical protein HPB48_016568 [Haemaphysalis longicornis]|uniref:Phospholipid scramblase n=1 Tax=Haemaphysalis longicornis TaxID=44386 RepID=A0A9J6GN36_HAELO|nr:hypothetical protein HPB48_016568 [Haemaphysalis longicornis]
MYVNIYYSCAKTKGSFVWRGSHTNDDAHFQLDPLIGLQAPQAGPPCLRVRYVQGPGNGVANVVCAPGLEYLAGIDMIIVEQQLELAEGSRCCAKLCCGPRRCFEMDMVDYRGEAVVHVIRPLRCVQCWCFCCLQELQVQAPPGTPIGFVSQRCSLCYPTFTVYDRFYKPALTIVGPLCTQSLPCACDVKFEVRSLNGVAVGTITKKWSGLIKEYFTDIDNFGISFPMDLDVNMKATLLATTMLIVSSSLLLLLVVFALTTYLSMWASLLKLIIEITIGCMYLHFLFLSTSSDLSTRSFTIQAKVMLRH